MDSFHQHLPGKGGKEMSARRNQIPSCHRNFLEKKKKGGGFLSRSCEKKKKNPPSAVSLGKMHPTSSPESRKGPRSKISHQHVQGGGGGNVDSRSTRSLSSTLVLVRGKKREKAGPHREKSFVGPAPPFDYKRIWERGVPLLISPQKEDLPAADPRPGGGGETAWLTSPLLIRDYVIHSDEGEEKKKRGEETLPTYLFHDEEEERKGTPSSSSGGAECLFQSELVVGREGDKSLTSRV